MTTPEAKEIGKIFRDAREKAGISVEEANRRSRIHLNVINDIENGVFTRFSKLYLKSFLRKYAEFLGLDAENILEQYESIASGIPEKEFTPEIKRQEESKELSPIPEKTIQAVLIGLFSVALIVLVLVLVGRVKAKFTTSRSPEKVAALQKEKAAVPEKKQKPQAPPEEKKSFWAAKTSSVNLTIEARGEAWVKVTEGENTLFVGVLRKGSKKTWKSDKAINVWTGRAEMLDFTVNNKKLGRIADGVVKNIKVSSAGITINDNWVTRF
jgi:cytoskeletal protein RodZ